jgi:hypothetical protein
LSCDFEQFSPLKRQDNFEQFSAETPRQRGMFSAETPRQPLSHNRCNPALDKGFQRAGSKATSSY